MPPGFLAYLGDEPVGWCGVVVRTEAPRLVRSRTIPAIDDQPVWAIGCFRIRVGTGGAAWPGRCSRTSSRRRARRVRRGSRPTRSIPSGRRVDVGFAYVGIASMFDEAGFRRVLETGAHSAGLPRLLVRLDFDGATR